MTVLVSLLPITFCSFPLSKKKKINSEHRLSLLYLPQAARWFLLTQLQYFTSILKRIFVLNFSWINKTPHHKIETVVVCTRCVDTLCLLWVSCALWVAGYRYFSLDLRTGSVMNKSQKHQKKSKPGLRHTLDIMGQKKNPSVTRTTRLSL